MDRNTITGLVLIGLILTVFSIINRPTEEDIQKRKDELAKKEQVKTDSKKVLTQDTLNQDTLTVIQNVIEEENTASASDSIVVSKTPVIKDTVIIKETDKFIIHFTNIGGQIEALYLKEYKSYNDYKANKNNALCLFKKVIKIPHLVFMMVILV